jgi:hypothetical protein
MTQFNENTKVTGKVTFKHLDANGNVLFEQTVPNLVVTSGLEWMAARMIDSSIPSAMSHIGLGESDTTPALADVSLGAQLGRVSLTGSSVTDNEVTYTATFGSGAATGAVKEAGIFNASTGGTMLCRTTFPVINKGAADSLAVTWVITVS